MVGEILLGLRSCILFAEFLVGVAETMKESRVTSFARGFLRQVSESLANSLVQVHPVTLLRGLLMAHAMRVDENDPLPLTSS